MSRHSKWAKIKRQKSVTDAKRGQRFTKLLRVIAAAAREGGGDPATNVRLLMAIDQARGENMPQENIARAIERATGAQAPAATTSLILEGYAPGGAALLIDAVTDNRNRTVSDVRRLLADAGGSLGEAGSTQWMFARRGRLCFDGVTDADALELAAIDAGALDTLRDGRVVEVLTEPERLQAVAAALARAGYAARNTGLAMVPLTPRALPADAAAALATLLERLDEHEDVVEVTTDAVLAAAPGTARASQAVTPLGG